MNGGDEAFSFDAALGTFARLVHKHLGGPAVDAHRFIRDVDGRLSLLLLGDVDINKTRTLRIEAEKVPGPYASASVIETPSDLLDPSLETAFTVGEKVDMGTGGHVDWQRVPVVDRRIVGQDWASEPHVRQKDAPPIVTFHGVKGGVGRSTALAVTAVAEARKRRNVLVVDLDLEAPGIATLLLAQDDLPELGITDWLVETNIHPAEPPLDERYVAPSRLTAGRGAIDVLPALGKSASQAPWAVVPKLERAFVDQPGSGLSFMQRIRRLVDLARESGPHRYDVVLVDARAGLAETAAAALIGLGAHNLCFGIDTPPCHDGFRYLFSYLAGLAHAGQDDMR